MSILSRMALFGGLVLAVGCGRDETTGVAPSGSGGGGGSGGESGEDHGPTLPAATGTCPELVAGDVVFAPAGIPPRAVRLFLDPERVAAADGPLVFYWHGTGSNSLVEPPYGLGEAQAWVEGEGGIVAAPHSDPESGTFPWYLTTGGDNEADLLLADEVVACAVEQVGIDPRRIHVIGMSAGGLQTTQMSYRRSSYVASVVAYSGGLIGSPSVQDEENPFAAMIFHGGPSDTVIVNFETLSIAYRDDLASRGHFAFLCNHGDGHKIPKGNGEQAAVMAFFREHPWQTKPSPYADGLPAGFPSYCTL